MSFSNRPVYHFILIAALGLVAYSNTFKVPFQWDAKGAYVANNPVIKDLRYFIEPDRAKGLPQYDAIRGRYIGYLTFALNYRLHGLDVTGYHAVNVAIHILNAFLVYIMLLLTFKTPFMQGSKLQPHSGNMALLAALIFVSHPVQTEAVTYIFQRLASLAAMFYIGALVLYAKWRLDHSAELVVIPAKAGIQRLYLSGHESHWIPGQARNDKKLFLYLLSLLSALLAMKTKENAFTLPVVIALYEFLFFSTPAPPLSKGGIKGGYRLLWLIPFILTMLVIPLSLASTDFIQWASREGPVAPSGPEKGGGIAPLDYLITEPRVMLTYIRLIFFPAGQNLDYDYPVFHSILNPAVVFSLLFNLALILFGFYLFRKSEAHKSLRLAAFGIAWFYIALSVESSIIPLPMLIDEYRLYLPLAGAVTAITTGAFTFIARSGKNRAVYLLILIPLALAAATYARNNVWATDMSLWQDVVGKSPAKARGHYNLGLAYASRGLTYKSLKEFQTAAKLNPDDPKIQNNLALAFKDMRQADLAVEHFRRAISLKPDLLEAHFNLAMLYLEKGMNDDSRRELEAVLRIEPDNRQARQFIVYINGVIDPPSTQGVIDPPSTQY